MRFRLAAPAASRSSWRVQRWVIVLLLAVVLTQSARLLMYTSTAAGTTGRPHPASAERKTQWSTMGAANVGVGANGKTTNAKSKLQAFYNMFIPPSNETVSPVVRDMISEQLTQMLKSHGASAFDLVIHIVSLGHVVDAAWIENICASVMSSSTTNNKFQCALVAQFPEGDEVQTLTHVHDYCRAHESELVLYFHNKGSFHPSTMNDNWRRAITAALSSDLCLVKMTEPDRGDASSCDTCSMLFDPLPGPHYPGNMWAAARIFSWTMGYCCSFGKPPWVAIGSNRNIGLRDIQVYDRAI
jgi:hypothetical protein